MSGKIAKRTALFLGAGASVPYGYPITAGLLDRIWTGLLNPSGEYGWTRWAGMRGRKKEAGQLRRLIEALFPGLADRAELNDAVSIVDVISLVDQLVAEGRSPCPGVPEREVLAARRVLGKAINGVLQGKEQLEYADRFSQWALRAATETEDSRLIIVSTNYDTVFERPLFQRFIKHGLSVGQHVDFGMAWRDAFENWVHVRPPLARLSLLKLHGSLDWLRCEVCGHVTINVKQRIASLDAWARPSPRKYNVCWCEGLLRSLLVTPSVVRDVRDANLLGIWKAALEDLRMADEWIFVGYSLPAEDISIRSLLLRAWHARRRTRLRVKVVQFERNAADDCTPSATFSRYRMFFPSTALKETDYSRGGVQEFIDSLELLPEKQLGARLRKYLGGWSDAQIAAREREKRLMREEKALSKKRRRKRS